MEREEGEMTDDEEMMVDDKSELEIKQENCTILYKADKNGVIVKQLEKIDVDKLKERAQRFGIDLSINKIVTQKEIDELYLNFGIKGDSLRHFRCDTLHLSHIQDLTSKDIFEYLQDYRPVSLEWIDENSCNIVCQDHISAALALLLHSREIKNEELKVMLKENSLHHWRQGFPHPKNDLVLIRFATNGDKKVSKKDKDKGHSDSNIRLNNERDSEKSLKKNPWGDLCQTWGVYDHQEIFHNSVFRHDDDNGDNYVIKNKNMALRLGKRYKTKKHESDSESDMDSYSQKRPRMRMHADDEEFKRKKKGEIDFNKEESFLPLSVEVINSHDDFKPKKMINLSDKFKSFSKNKQTSQKETVQSRLGARVCPSVEEHPHHSNYDQHESSPAGCDVPKSVWQRLEKQPEHAKSKTDLREILKTKKKPHDLRSVISKSKHENIRVEIDNT